MTIPYKQFEGFDHWVNYLDGVGKGWNWATNGNYAAGRFSGQCYSDNGGYGRGGTLTMPRPPDRPVGRCRALLRQ